MNYLITYFLQKKKELILNRNLRNIIIISSFDQIPSHLDKRVINSTLNLNSFYLHLVCFVIICSFKYLQPEALILFVMNRGSFDEHVTPLSGPTQFADPNWFRDACIILFIYLFFLNFRDPNPWPDPNGGSEPELDLLRPFSFILSKHFTYVISL